MSDQRQIFTLKQVVSSIRKTIEERYQQLYWVKAEMHKLNRYPSGHCFPELLWKEDGKVVAQINASIWKHNFERINQRFIEVVKEPIKEDTTLLIQVRITFHETYGMSLQILDIDPNYALGELQKERMETLRKLKEAGLLNANQLLDFPLLPKRIAVISAESSKGLSDFNKVLDQNSWGYHFFRMLFPAYLQGDQAADSIIQALERIKKVKQHFDIVVIVRGGGGEVGLSCYNNYELCRAIASFPLPVLTGIGHSTNLTVSEMIAYRNAITPTELGEFLIQCFHNYSVPLKDAIRTVRMHIKQIIEQNKQKLLYVSGNFRHSVRRMVRAEHHHIDTKRQELKSGLIVHLLNRKDELKEIRSEVIHGTRMISEKQLMILNNVGVQLGRSGKNAFIKQADKLSGFEQTIKLVDPINVLKRGYSMTLYNGKVIGENTRPVEGEHIHTVGANYTIESTVNTIKERDE